MKAFLTITLLLCLIFQLTDAKNGLCNLLTEEDFGTPQDWLNIITGKYTRLPLVRYATTKVWETNHVQGLDNVGLSVIKTIHNDYMTDYSLVPHTTNRNVLNVHTKELFIRLGYFNTTTYQDTMNLKKGKKRVKHHAYYSMEDLISCNAIFLKDDNIDPTYLEWSYKVLERE